MEISVKNIGLGLFSLVAVLVLLNIFFIMPSLSLKPVQISSIQEEIAEIVEPDTDAVLAVDSLSIIKKSSSGEGVIHIDSDDQILRNPFFWPGEKAQKDEAKDTAAAKPESAKPAAAEPEAQKPRLSMVIISAGRKQALLDDLFVREGDNYNGYKVKNISANEVVLSNYLGDLSILLTTSEEESDQEQSPGGIIEQDDTLNKK
jgi:hypothetical protein